MSTPAIAQVGAEPFEHQRRPRRPRRRLSLAAQLDERRGEAHGRRAVVDLDDDSRGVAGTAPAFARGVHVPRAGHLHVRVQDVTVGKMHEEVLARRVDRGDLGAGLGPAPAARVASKLEIDETLAGERGPQLRGRPENRVTFGHAAIVPDETAGTPLRRRRHKVAVDVHSVRGAPASAPGAAGVRVAGACDPGRAGRNRRRTARGPGARDRRRPPAGAVPALWRLDRVRRARPRGGYHHRTGRRSPPPPPRTRAPRGDRRADHRRRSSGAHDRVPRGRGGRVGIALESRRGAGMGAGHARCARESRATARAARARTD